MTTLYAKHGRRYHPVAEYDPQVIDALPEGSHLVIVKPGHRTIFYQVDPDAAGLLAVLNKHENQLVTAIQKASSMQMESRLLTRREKKAIEAYRYHMGPDAMLTITLPSAMSILDGLRQAIVENKP